MRYTRGQLLLRAQADRNPPLGDPPARLNAETVAEWHEIVAACPPVLRLCDCFMVETAASHLRVCRHLRAEGVLDRTRVRAAYRTFGRLLMPMRERRRLLFGDSVPPSRSRRV